MATKTILLGLLVYQRILTTHTTTGFLDFSELQSVNYGIDILGNPVVRGEDDSDAVYLTSIYGQQYQCQIPNVVSDDQREREEEKTALETGIAELLRPMEEGPCLMHTKDWWTYEFCYGDKITQYHMEDGKVSGEITTLGTYETDFDWSNTTQEKHKNRLGRYHSQQYVNGSHCDLTGKERHAQVRFVCELGHGDYIARIEEPATCVYTLFVHTSKLCHHPYLKPRTPKQPVQIQCRPLLTAEEYVQYEEEMAVKKREEEEFRAYQKQLQKRTEEQAAAKKAVSEALGKQSAHPHHKLGTMIDEGETVTDESFEQSSSGATLPLDADYPQMSEALDETVAVLQDIFTEELAKGLQEILEENGYTGSDFTPKPDTKLMYNAEKNSEEEKKKKADAPTKRTVVTPVHIEKRQLSDDEAGTSWPAVDTTRQTVYEEVDQEGRRRTFLRDQAGTMVVIQKDPGFGTPTVQEIDDEITPDPSNPSDEDEDFLRTFDEELDNILGEHPDRQRLAKYKETIESAITAQFSDMVQEAEQEMAEGPLEPAERNQALESLGKTLNKLLDKLDAEDSSAVSVSPADDGSEEEDEIWDEDAVTMDTKKDQDTELAEQPSSTKDDRVRVRLTRVKESPQGSVESQQGGEAAKIPGEIKIPEEQKAQLESKMKTELEKAGMDTTGRKIEVKIITAGYYDSDNEQLHILNDDESNAFNNMIITILQGHSEADKEEQHHLDMQQNYEFQWGNRKKKTPLL